MLTRNIKSIKLNITSFTDMYGNTYFTGNIYVNDNAPVYMPFQYGYGNHAEYMAINKLIELKIISPQMAKKVLNRAPSIVCRDFLKCSYEVHFKDVKKRDML